jgi:putative tryptophan/tyrosine transport system substrate-binding protein
MRRIGLAVVLTVGLVLAPLAAEAQSAGNARRIGYLGPPRSTGGPLEAFQQGLRELGYIEGRNIIIEYRYTGSGRDIDTRLPLLAAELVQLKPEVLVVSIDQAALVLFAATAVLIFAGVQVIMPTTSPLPFYAYPVFVATLGGWIWSLTAGWSRPA